MSFTVGAADLARLRSVVETLLAPLSAEDPGRWIADVSRRLEELLGNESRCTFFLTGVPHPVVAHTSLEPATIRAYVDHYAALDVPTRRILERRMEVAHPWLVESRAAHHASEFFNDFAEPHRVPGMLALNTFDGGIPGPRVVVTFPVDPDEAELEKGRHLLRTLAPAFRAGVETWSRLSTSGGPALAGALDLLEEGILVSDEAGRPVHRNAALVRLLGDEPEKPRLEVELEGLARSASAFLTPKRDQGSVSPTARDIVVGPRRYRAGACLVPEGLFGTGRSVLVTVRPLLARPLADGELRERFGLTAKEAEVARLLARGLSNAELAASLFISPNTARIHVERVLRKLGAERRSRVGPILRGEERGGVAA